MTGSRLATSKLLWTLLAFSALWLETAEGQVDYGGRIGQVQSGIRSFEPQGPATSMDAADPAMRKWYLPQALHSEFGRWQWETINYARDPYQRYVDPTIEGEFFYDLYGNQLSQGWLIFNTSQTTPLDGGHVVLESSQLSEWFSGVAIASEKKGQYRYALTVGRDLRTTLTPMVFSKPRFNGVQLDFLTNKYMATLLYSQGGIGGATVERPRTDVTTIMGGRFVAQVGDFVELGVHMANAHQSNSLNSRLMDNLISGSLPESKNQQVSTIEIVLRDDSPEDRTGGAAYFPAGSDIIITYLDGSQDTGKDIRFEPVVQGGVPGQGFLTANGDEEIRLTYDFTDPSFVTRARADRSEIVRVEFRLTLANDYQIWMSSDQQSGRTGDVLLIVDRAEGNVRDGSNVRVVEFEYGLPTATNVIGGSVKVSDVMGFDLYGEYDLGWSYRKYPNPLAERHAVSSGVRGKRSTPVWMLNLGKQSDRFFFFGEAYSVDPMYNTQTFITSVDGSVDYKDDRLKMELVDDNDDQDRLPDLFRFDTVAQTAASNALDNDISAVDFRVFPGWDRNNDFIPDYNQNDNRAQPNTIPDYEEPFLRFGSDRPEFVFGVDMNHNYWVDQFENDAEPDYPYRKDHEGFNLFGGVHLTPDLEVKVGALREHSIASERRNRSDYVMLGFSRTSPRWGRLRLFEMLESVRDDIEDPLLQWVPDNALNHGQVRPLVDPLLARDTWVNRSFVGHHWQRGTFFAQSKLSYFRFAQRLDEQERLLHGLDKSDFFFGLINKAAYRYRLGSLELVPRWKSEYINQSRGLFGDEERTALTELFSGLVIMPLLSATTVQAGVEYLLSQDLDGGRADDFTTRSIGLQMTSSSAFQGYVMWMVTGFTVARTDPRGEDAFTRVQSFISVYAGLE
jgi:hypothetical protein